MMVERTYLKSGEARVEFLACYEKVEELLVKGHSVSAIYKFLRDKGVITMSCRTLQDKIKKICKAPPGPGLFASIPNRAFGAHTARAPLPAAPSPGLQLKELDEVMELAAVQREKEPKKSGKEGEGYSRKKVIG